MNDKIRIGVLGASGYTGADLVRLALLHPRMEITALTANTHAGKSMAEVFPHFSFVELPRLTTVDDADWGSVDAVFCGLPHGTTQEITRAVLAQAPEGEVHRHVGRLPAPQPGHLQGLVRARAHGHGPPGRRPSTGSTEHYRTAIRDARLVACPGCYPTATLLALLPLASSGKIDVSDIVIDAKSGVSGAGRGLKQNLLFTEAGEGLSPYSRRQAPPRTGNRAGDRQGIRARR